MFIEQSYLLLNSFGSLALIVPNTWLINKSMLSFRKYLLQTFSINKIVDFSKEKVFDATVLPIVFVGSKKKTNSPIAIIDPDNNFVEKFVINLEKSGAKIIRNKLPDIDNELHFMIYLKLVGASDSPHFTKGQINALTEGVRKLNNDSVIIKTEIFSLIKFIMFFNST